MKVQWATLICYHFLFFNPKCSVLFLVAFMIVIIILVDVVVPPTQLILSPFYTNSLLPIQTKSMMTNNTNKITSTKSNTKHHKDRHHSHHHHPKHHQSYNVSSSMTVIEVSEGEKIMLKCRTSSMTKPMTKISWTRNGVPFTEGLHERVVHEDEEKRLFMTESTINLFVKLEDRSSDYKCTAHHPGLSAEKVISDQVRLSVLYAPGKPEIEGYSTGEDVLNAGDKLTLACMSRGGNPAPSLVWFRESEIVDSSSSLLSSDSGSLAATTNTYSLTVKPQDNKRTFRCEASNIIQTLSTQIRLDVHFAPVNIKINGPSVGRINDILRYECIIGPSNPLPTQVTWLINGLPQKEGVYPVENWKEEVSFGFMTKTNITVLLSESIKSVSCMASSAGSSSSTTPSTGASNQDSSTIQASIDVHVLCKIHFPFSCVLSNFVRKYFDCLPSFPFIVISFPHEFDDELYLESSFGICLLILHD